jgi:phage shock protein C
MQNVQSATVENGAYESNEPDSLFGVCQAIGEDFGFNPFYLRVVLLALLFFSPWAVLGAYAALAVAVVGSRFLFPRSKSAAAEIVEAPAAQVHAEAIAPQPEMIAA